MPWNIKKNIKPNEFNIYKETNFIYNEEEVKELDM